MMDSAKYVGRVGALAVALGIGVAMATTPGAAWADDAPSESSSDPSAPSDVSASVSADSTDASPGGVDMAPDVSTEDDATADAPDSAESTDASSGDLDMAPDVSTEDDATADARDSVAATGVPGATTTIPEDASPAVTVSGFEGDLEVASDQQPAIAIRAEEPVTLEVASAAASSSSDVRQPLSATSGETAPVEVQPDFRPALAPDVDTDVPTAITAPVGGELPVAPVSAGDVSGETPMPMRGNTFQVSAVSARQAAPPATSVNVAAGLVTAALAPFLAPVAPAAPVQSLGLWGLLAWVRRQIQHTFFNRTPTIAYDPAENIQLVDGVITGDLRAADPDGDPLTFIVTEAPEHGSVVVNRDGTFVYTPNADFARFGSDTFTITVDDGVTYRLPGLAGVIQSGLHWGARVLGLSGSDRFNSHPTVRVKAKVIDTIVVGDGPGQLAVSPDGATIYVPNAYDDTVSVVDTATNTVTDTIAVEDGPLWVAISPDGATAYVTHPGGVPDDPSGHTVSVIDTATNTVTTTVTVGDVPLGLAVSPDGATVYVTNSDDDSVSVIDTASNSVVDSITVGDAPGGLAVSPDGATVYVVNVNDHTVSVIDTASNTVVDSITVGNYPIIVGEYPSAVAVSPDGTRAYVTVADGTVLVIGTATNTVAGTVAVGGSPALVAVSPDGTRAYVTNPGDDTLSVIRTATNTVIATVTVGDAPRGLVLSPDGTRAYVTNLGDDTVSVISLGT
jgi:YVTN family beta-propeller protein